MQPLASVSKLYICIAHDDSSVGAHLVAILVYFCLLTT